MELPWTVGEGQQYETLTVFPLYGAQQAPIDYALARDALARGDLIVSEISDAGAIPQLRACNRGATRVLFLEGEELTGGKQNRMLTVSLCLDPGAETTIPVCCVEQGRWRSSSPQFASTGLIASPRLRYAIKASVARSLRARWGHRAEQVCVWHAIEHQQARLGTASPTLAWHDTVLERRHEIAPWRQALPWIDGAQGIAVALGGGATLADFFDRPETCRTIWPHLVTAAVLDAMAKPLDRRPADRDDVERLLTRVAELPWWDVDGLGGRERRGGNGGVLHASLFQVEGATLHGSIIDGGAL
jgi:hypothetical protein